MVFWRRKKTIPFNRFKNWPSFSSSYTKQILDKQIKCHIFLSILDCQDIYIGTKAARWGRSKLIRIKSGRSTIQIWRLKIEHVQRIKGDRDDSPILVEWTLCRWATCLSIHLLACLLSICKTACRNATLRKKMLKQNQCYPTIVES